MKVLLGMFVVLLFVGVATCRADSYLSVNMLPTTFELEPDPPLPAIPGTYHTDMWFGCASHCGQDFATGTAVITATAEPATGLLVGLGLAVATLIRRRRKKLVDPTVWENLG